MKQSMLLNIKAAVMLLLVGLVPATVTAQTNLTYDEVIGLIGEFQSQKNYIPASDDAKLSSIIQGMIYYADANRSEGLKMRLVGKKLLAKKKVSAMADSGTNEGKLLAMFYFTQQSIVSSQLTDKALKALVGKKGNGIKRSVAKVWNNKATKDSIGVLEEYPPETALKLVFIISRVWFANDPPDYEAWEGDETWAAQSLNSVYLYARVVEFARNSIVVRLLGAEGLISIPANAYAEYRYSGWPTVTIKLNPPSWSSNDIPELKRLLTNPYYKAAAQAQLTKMGQ